MSKAEIGVTQVFSSQIRSIQIDMRKIRFVIFILLEHEIRVSLTNSATAVGSNRRRFVGSFCRPSHIQVDPESITWIAKLIEQFSDAIEISCLNLIFYVTIRRKDTQSVIFLPGL